MTEKKLANKVALVTGAGRGIGKAIALELASLGATVVGVSNEQVQVDHITEFLKQHGYVGRGMFMDVSDADSAERGLAEIEAEFGAPAILVNNAGITSDNLVLRMSQEEWDRVMRVNLTSVYLLSKLNLRGMIKARWGRIINVTSVVAFTGNAGQANYSASKAAMLAFGKSLALEVASRGITVNAVAPGFIETDMTHKLTDEQRERIFNTVPLRRIGQGVDIAKAVAFLATDDAGYMTGTTLHVNGGMFTG